MEILGGHHAPSYFPVAANDGGPRLHDDGEAARLIRNFDWAATPLGPASEWSPSLRMVVRFLLANRFPLLLWWGPDYIQIYNDHYAPILGAKHPHAALGRPFRECWSEVYDVLRPLVDTPFFGGPATWMEDIELIVRRHDFPEESHFTIAYSPVPDETAPRGIGGVLATVHEITEKVIGERRIKLLSELGAHLAETKSEESACRRALSILAGYSKDVPFAVLYLFDESRENLRLLGATGIDTADAGLVDVPFDEAAASSPWPLAEALGTEVLQTRHDLAALLGRVAPGPWADVPDMVAVVPIRSNVAHRPAGALVVGVSACIRFDQRYRDFLELVGTQVATAVANARAYAEERRRAEVLAELDRAKTLFFSNISHEFRTPLTLMLGPLDDALSWDHLSPAARTSLTLAQRNARRLLKLVNSLLDFARIEAGRSNATFAPVDLAAATTDLASTFRSAMQRAGLQFDVRCEPLPEPVYVDRDLWEKIVLNLLSNAFKFTLHGSVTVWMRGEAGHVVLEVRDTGVGIPEHELPRVFERFHRIEGTPSRTHEGSGIGLALVQELVKLHGGTIDVESVERSGTVFRVRIPFGRSHLPDDKVEPSRPEVRAPNPDAQVYVQEALRWLPEAAVDASEFVVAPAEPGNDLNDARFASTFGSRILLADDNADMRGYVRGLLARHYRVEVAEDGVQALQAARRERPDLILCDVMMPNLDGLGLLQTLRQDAGLKDVPVVLISARAGEDERIHGFGAGADDYVVKPFHARELLARIGALLELQGVRHDSDERFRAFVQATSDVVYRMSADWGALLSLVGHRIVADQTDPNSHWLQKYIHPDDRAAVLARVEDARRTRGVFQLEHRVIRADGTPGWVFSRAIPVFDKHGDVVEWFGTATDVTARHEFQDKLQQQRRALEQADRQKNEFLAMLAHELRNPLAPIRNAGEFLSRTVEGDDRTRCAVATIARQVTHLTRLVDDLLDISRITQGRIELRRQVLDLDRVVANAVEALEPTIRRQGHVVVVNRSLQPLRVDADPERLVQCFGNLLANAAKYTPDGGQITVVTDIAEGHARVRICDTGVGIPHDLLPRIFDLFVQGERTLDRSQGGLGVGLTIVHRLIEMHGGSVTVSSPGPNRGSCFEVRLPLVAHATRDDEQDSPVTRDASSKRILVVDDNGDGAAMLAQLLAFEGHDVAVAESAHEALDRLRAQSFDVALVDIGLPGMDGYALACRIRADSRWKSTRLIAITGYGQPSDRDKAHAAGFSRHLVKPVEFESLRQLLAEPTETRLE